MPNGSSANNECLKPSRFPLRDMLSHFYGGKGCFCSIHFATAILSGLSDFLGEGREALYDRFGIDRVDVQTAA